MTEISSHKLFKDTYIIREYSEEVISDSHDAGTWGQISCFGI